MKVRVRTLRIGSREFRWTAELCGHYDLDRDYHRCVRVRVWGGGKNGRMMRVDLESTEPGPRGGVPDCAYPTPRVVRAIVDYALENGWALGPSVDGTKWGLTPERRYQASGSLTASGACSTFGTDAAAAWS